VDQGEVDVQTIGNGGYPENKTGVRFTKLYCHIILFWEFFKVKVQMKFKINLMFLNHNYLFEAKGLSLFCMCRCKIYPIRDPLLVRGKKKLDSQHLNTAHNSKTGNQILRL
jgi:hypothetical protein